MSAFGKADTIIRGKSYKLLVDDHGMMDVPGIDVFSKVDEYMV